MQKNNSERQDSKNQPTVVGVDETSSDWEFDGVTTFRAMGYVVGLLSFMVGTAIFMLGFSLKNGSLTQAGAILYGIAVAALSGRVLIDRLKPRNEKQAAWIGVSSLVVGGCIYSGLRLLIWSMGLP
jgi:hypothetical protein